MEIGLNEKEFTHDVEQPNHSQNQRLCQEGASINLGDNVFNARCGVAPTSYFVFSLILGYFLTSWAYPIRATDRFW